MSLDKGKQCPDHRPPLTHLFGDLFRKQSSVVTVTVTVSVVTVTVIFVTVTIVSVTVVVVTIATTIETATVTNCCNY